MILVVAILKTIPCERRKSKRRIPGALRHSVLSGSTGSTRTRYPPVKSGRFNLKTADHPRQPRLAPSARARIVRVCTPQATPPPAGMITSFPAAPWRLRHGGRGGQVPPGVSGSVLPHAEGWPPCLRRRGLCCAITHWAKCGAVARHNENGHPALLRRSQLPGLDSTANAACATSIETLGTVTLLQSRPYCNSLKAPIGIRPGRYAMVGNAKFNANRHSFQLSNS